MGDRPVPQLIARLAGAPDVQVFLGRLTHLDPAALVRLRPIPTSTATVPPRTGLWARLPWGVLVTRQATLPVPGDVTVGAAALLSGGSAPAQDAQWRWALPPGPGTLLEEVPASQVRQVAAAAAGTLREVSERGLAGRSVGVRVLREALLDHVAIVVEGESGRVEVPQRLVQAVVRMGFLGETETPARVRRAGPWLGLTARYGAAWLPPASGPGLPIQITGSR